MAALGGIPSYTDHATLYAEDGTSWRPDITVEYHSHDGFTLWGSDREGCLVHRRFVGYTVTEARRMFRRELTEGA
jgi:hypothetical protein